MKHTISFLLIFIHCLLLIGCSGKQVVTQVSSVDIIEYGKFYAEESRRDFSINADMGGVRKSKNQKLIESGDTLSLELGKNIGFRYQVNGSPSSGEKEITLKIIYPSKGITNPKNGKAKSFYQATNTKEIGNIYFHSFHFRHEWEAVPGKWIFQVLVDGQIMAEKQFTMISKG